MIRRVRILAACVLALTVAPMVAAEGQQASRRTPAAARQGGAPPGRVQLEREVRARLHDIMRREMRLDDAQIERLDRTLTTYEGRRRALLRDEREARMALRDAMGTARSADSTRERANDAIIAASLDTLLVIQQRRVDLVIEEQRELATFLTPLQRARYFALQENLRRVLEERGGGRPGGPPARRPPGGGNPPPR